MLSRETIKTHLKYYNYDFLLTALLNKKIAPKNYSSELRDKLFDYLGTLDTDTRDKAYRCIRKNYGPLGSLSRYKSSCFSFCFRPELPRHIAKEVYATSEQREAMAQLDTASLLANAR